MTDDLPQRAPKPYVSEGDERARALAAVMRDQEGRADAELVADARRQRRTRWRRRSLVALWLVIAYVWVGSPSWLSIEPPPEPTFSQEAQALRLAMFFQSQAIEAYRLERGRLPYVLQEAGPPFPGMEYRRKDSRSYELLGTSDRLRLDYQSEQDPLDWVGAAASLVVATSGDAGSPSAR
jgi:hypothetical protein